MHAPTSNLAFFRMTSLLAAIVVTVARIRSMVDRILALDTLTLVLVALLVLCADANRFPYYLDAALVLALLAFVSDPAATRYYGERKVF